MGIERALPDDLDSILDLYSRSRYAFLDGGLEDLGDLLKDEPVSLLTQAGRGVVAFAALRSSPPPHESRPGSPARATLAATLVAKRLSPQRALPALFLHLLGQLDTHQTDVLVHCLSEARWLNSVLESVGFSQVDSIRYYRRTRFDVPQLDGPVTFSPLTLDLIGELARLDGKAFDILWHMDRDALLQLSITCRIQLAWLDGRMVGYSAVSLHPSSDPGSVGVAQLVRLAVVPDLARQGIGSQLLADAIGYAHQNSIRTIILNTQMSNRVSQKLYTKFGFRPYGSRVPVMALHRSSPVAQPETVSNPTASSRAP